MEPLKSTGEDERELLIKLKEGDHRAFERLYHQYKTHLTSHLAYMFRSTEIGRDIAQDTFLTVWDKRETIDADKSFKSYLFTIATNKAYNTFRSAAHDEKLRNSLKPLIEEGLNHVEEYILNKENHQLLEDLLLQMPERQREVFRLAKIDGLSYKAITEQLGISHNTINTHIKRASAFLKEQAANRPDLILAVLAASCYSAATIV